MKVRPREPEKVRADAVRIAVTKFEEGCDHCGDGYLRLARENGATEGDVKGALTGAGKSISRRVMLKWSAISLGIALTGDALTADPAAAATNY